jgi:hypothetical protein
MQMVMKQDFYAGKSLDGLSPDPRYQPEHKSRSIGAPISFRSGGTFESGYQSHFYQRTKIYGAKFDLTSQVSNQHEIKFGGQWRYYDINTHSFDIVRDTTNFTTPTIFPESTTRNNRYTKNPFEFSFYLQDKMEFDKLIVNVGLRYDFFNSQSRYSTMFSIQLQTYHSFHLVLIEQIFWRMLRLNNSLAHVLGFHSQLQIRVLFTSVMDIFSNYRLLVSCSQIQNMSIHSDNQFMVMRI